MERTGRATIQGSRSHSPQFRSYLRLETLSLHFQRPLSLLRALVPWSTSVIAAFKANCSKRMLSSCVDLQGKVLNEVRPNVLGR